MDPISSMNRSFSRTHSLPGFSLWEKVAGKRIPLTFDLEITTRCNNNCRHCYINRPTADPEAIAKELRLPEIRSIAEQAVALGSLWCLITGGEPLLRPDFPEIYLLLRRMGLLVSVFTNACLLSKDHINLFKEHPPRNLEITVYGITQETYEQVTRQTDSYKSFRRGFDSLLEAGIPFRLKAMAMRSNAHELQAIAAFCRKYTRDYFRFDPLLHLRYDGDEQRNADIIQERLSAQEIVVLEASDPERSSALEKNCQNLIFPESIHSPCGHLFRCGAGKDNFIVGHDGYFRVCSALWHPSCLYDLKTGTLAEAWQIFTPGVLGKTSTDKEFLTKCHDCPIINLCLWCPAHAHLERGRLDAWCEYFCQVGQARAEALEFAIGEKERNSAL